MNQPILVALIAIIIFIMWMSIGLWEIRKDISELRTLLSSAPVAQKPKSSKDIGNSQHDVKQDPK
jgi:hypothetical protein